HHRRVPATLTLHAQQTMLEPATLEVRLELAPHERRPPASPVVSPRPRKERRQMRHDGPVEHRLLLCPKLCPRPPLEGPKRPPASQGPKEKPLGKCATYRGASICSPA